MPSSMQPILHCWGEARTDGAIHSRAGCTLSRSSLSRIIIEYCFRQKQCSILNINGLLFAYGQPLPDS